VVLVKLVPGAAEEETLVIVEAEATAVEAPTSLVGLSRARCPSPQHEPLDTGIELDLTGEGEIEIGNRAALLRLDGQGMFRLTLATFKGLAPVVVPDADKPSAAPAAGVLHNLEMEAPRQEQGKEVDDRDDHQDDINDRHDWGWNAECPSKAMDGPVDQADDDQEDDQGYE
jgi:hypothetical protein